MILANPRYTGRQVWNKQRKDEVLLDVDDVALGYQTRMRWNDKGAWIWSDTEAHTPLVSTEQFEAAQAIRADHGRTRQAQRETYEKVRHPHVLRALIFCGLCGRKLQVQSSNGTTYYRCRYPREYALANHVKHPLNVYVRERDVLPALDGWLATVLAPHRLDHTIRTLAAAQPDAGPVRAAAAPASDLQATIAECDARLTRYQAALDAGGDPATIAAWTRTVQTERAAALAKAAAQQPRGPHGCRRRRSAG